MTGRDSRGALVMAHGIFDTGALFNRMARHFGGRGWRTIAPSLHPRSGAAGLDVLAAQLKDVIDREVPPEEPLCLIGFSMGGLVSRYYLQRLGGLERVRRFVAISAPQHGSFWARFVPSRGGRQMRPDSDFLRDLNGDLDRLAQIPVLTLWTPLDLMILPATSSLIPIGETRRIVVPLHTLMLHDRRVFAAVAEFLEKEGGR